MLKTRFKHVISATVLTLLLIGWMSGCDDVVETPGEPDVVFYPTALGLSWTYAVDSVFYDKFTETADTFQYMRKDTIHRSILVQDSLEQFEVDVYLKTDTTDWAMNRSYRVYTSTLRAVRISNNLPTVDMVYPIRNRVSWNANQLNALSPDIYRYSDEHKQAFAQPGDFDETRLVLQAFDTTIIDEFIRWKVYAKAVGLVEQRRREVTKDNGILGGFDVHTRLIDFKDK